MIKLEDVGAINIGELCIRNYPCEHVSKITLQDGREAIISNTFDATTLLSRLSEDKINPSEQNKDWKGKAVKKHFQFYTMSLHNIDQDDKAATIILNRIFQNDKPTDLDSEMDMEIQEEKKEASLLRKIYEKARGLFALKKGYRNLNN